MYIYQLHIPVAYLRLQQRHLSLHCSFMMRQNWCLTVFRVLAAFRVTPCWRFLSVHVSVSVCICICVPIGERVCGFGPGREPWPMQWIWFWCWFARLRNVPNCCMRRSFQFSSGFTSGLGNFSNWMLSGWK